MSGGENNCIMAKRRLDSNDIDETDQRRTRRFIDKLYTQPYIRNYASDSWSNHPSIRDYRRSLHSASVGEMSESTGTGSLVYVVDDDAAIARLITVNLAARGYRVRQFSEGKSALDSLGEDAPDLVILDILMPGINGLEVASQVRRVSTRPHHDAQRP